MFVQVACTGNNLELINLLVINKADVNRTTVHGNTALNMAVKVGNKATVGRGLGQEAHR